MTVTASPSTDDSNGEFEVYPYQLTTWIEAQPDLEYLVKAANESPALFESSSNTLSVAPLEEDVVSKRYFGLRSKLKEFFWPSARSMRGQSYGTESFDETCSKAANTMSGSTLWDGISTVPFVQFALINYLKWAALPAAIGISLGLMILSNVAGRLSVNRSKGKEVVATTGLALFILLSFAKTFLSGVGFDILVNQDGITREYASKVLANQLEKSQLKLEELQSLKNPKLLNYQNSCEPLKALLPSIDKTLEPAKWESVYVQAFGTYAQQESVRGLTNEQVIKKYGGVNQIPGVCKRADMQLALDLKQADKMQANIANWNSKVGTVPPLQLLQSEFPEVFKREFKINDDGQVEIRSGQQVVGEAFLQFFDKLQDPEKIFQLGISLFWMAVSLILSVLATILLWALSRNKEMKWSFSRDLLQSRATFLQANQDNLPLALRRRRERLSQENTNAES